MSLKTAGRAFIGLAFALLGGGVIVLHAALHQRWSPWPLLTFFFLYNSVFLWGSSIICLDSGWRCSSAHSGWCSAIVPPPCSFHYFQHWPLSCSSPISSP